MTAHPTRTITHFHTFYPDVQAEIDRLLAEDRRLAAAEADGQPPRRMSERESPRATIAARLAELRATIASGAVRITLAGIPRRQYRAILTANPPRPDVDMDQKLGYNSDTFGEHLIAASIVSVTDMAGEPVENRWDDWADQMTDGQWMEVFTAALALQRQGNPVFPL